jgi:predicted permease
MIVINTIAPISLIVLLGLIFQRIGFMKSSFFKQNNRFVYYIGLPFLILSKTSQAPLSKGQALRISLILIIGMVIGLFLAYFLAWLQKIPNSMLGTYVQGSFRGNLTYLGLPVVLSLISGQNKNLLAGSEMVAVLSIIPMIFIYNIMSVVVLTIGKQEMNDDRDPFARMLLKNVLSNPILISCLLGIMLSVGKIALPVFLKKFCAILGQMALPLALLSLGSDLSSRPLRNIHFKYAVSASLIKVLAVPAVVYLIGLNSNLTVFELKISLLYLACPTAVNSFILAGQLKGNGLLAKNIVVISHLFSIVPITYILTVI